MGKAGLMNDAVHWFISDLTSRIVAESGNPSDRYHLGKLTLQSLKDDPDFLMQIDGATGDSETNGSALERSVRCATSFINFGLQKGDVMVLMAPSHIHLAIPFQAALYLGIKVAPVDRTFGTAELLGCFDVLQPKIIFCQSEKATQIQLVLNELDLNSQIVIFDSGDYLCTFTEFLEKYGDENIDVNEFKPTELDPEEDIAFLIPTSGTTGLPKSAAVTHKSFAITGPYLWARHRNFPTPTRTALVGSPLQWLTALFSFLVSPIVRYTRLQSSKMVDQQHAYHLINTYRPTFAILSPTMMTTLIRPGDREQCDFTCFEQIFLGGSAVPRELIDGIHEISPETEVVSVYGMTELANIAFHTEYPVHGTCGRPLGCFQYRLVNLKTKEDVNEPHVNGELWLKGPGLFKEYYKNPKATAETFAEDGWFKTGDMFYRDTSWNYFFVERIKLLLKFKSYQISPVEIENIIRQNPDVLDVAVAGIPDPECGDLPVACVVRRNGSTVTAREIKDLVKNSLSDAKQLRGGVVFVDEIPLTASTKIHRRKIQEMVMNMVLE